MKKMMKRTLAFVLTLAMCFAFVPSAMAAEGDKVETDPPEASAVTPDINGSKSVSPTELTNKNRETTVTLSLPSAEYKNEYDIVFVMDSSSSEKNSNIDFSSIVSSLMDSLTEKDADINVGVVKFRGLAFDMIKHVSNGEHQGLVKYSSDTKDIIRNAISFKGDDLEPLSNGSNLHGGLYLANQMLENHDEDKVDNSHKYVIALTDGKNYIWNNGEEATSYYSQYYGKQSKVHNNSIMNNGSPGVTQTAGVYVKNIPSYWVEVLGNKVFYPTTYEELYNNTDMKEELSSTNTKYDVRCGYAYKEDAGVIEGTPTSRATTNGTSLFGTGTFKYYQDWYEFIPSENSKVDWGEKAWLEANPYEVIDNGDGTYTFDTENANPDFYLYHPDCLQKGLYQAGHFWTNLAEKYHVAAITYSGYNNANLQIARSFNSWLQKNSEYGADISDSSAVEAMFNSIKEDILYMVNSGTVTDVIPDTFTLVDNGTDTFKLTLNGEPLVVTADGENAWNYQLPSEGEEQSEPEGSYPYRVEYNTESQTITWRINVPVENLKQVKLSYNLRIGEQAVSGRSYYTNTSAELAYNTSENTTGTYVFEKPQVTYTELYHVDYNANGGTGEVVDTVDYPSGSQVKLRDNDFTRPGYTFSGWSTDPNGTAEYQPGGTFENLTADTTFYAIWTRNSNPTPRPPVDIDDPDVPLDLNGADHFAYIEGYPDGTVQPGGNITRAEVSTMIYRLLTEDRRAEIFTDQNDYSDVEKPNWFNKAVSSMTVGKYVTGYPDGTFLPNQAITRAEFVTIVVRFLDGMKASENPFSDIDGHWAKDYILSAVDAGWIDGYPDGTFQPDKAITRAEAMKIMNMILHRGVNETSELGEPVMFPDNSDAGQWYYYEVIEATNDHETEGERPDEQWKSNTIDYTYDIVKYERP